MFSENYAVILINVLSHLSPIYPLSEIQFKNVKLKFKIFIHKSNQLFYNYRVVGVK